MKKLSVILIILVFCSDIFAQNEDNDPSIATKGPRKQLATIIYAGLGGAVLGLSTLSFHGRPQDHLGNIAGGFAVGIIVGTIVSTYSVTTDPSRLRSENLYIMPEWKDSSTRLNTNKDQAYKLSYSWNF